MNNKKQLIQILVIMIAFGGAGFVLYQGGIFGSTASQEDLQIDTSAQVIEQAKGILPHGESLEFKPAIDSSRFNYNQIESIVLNPNQDVGINVSNLVTPEIKE